jgi:hypothetical protein
MLDGQTQQNEMDGACTEMHEKFLGGKPEGTTLKT